MTDRAYDPNGGDRNGTTESEDTEKISWVEDLARSICSSADLPTLEVVPRPYLIGGWFQQGDLGFVHAQRGVGKSFFAMDMAHALAEARRFGPWDVHKAARVLYLDGEMPLDTIRDRDRKIGQPTPNLSYVNHGLLFDRSGRVMNLANLELQGALHEVCQRQQTDVLILDNLSTLVSGVAENKGEDWETLQPWLLQMRRKRVSVVFVHHSGRDPRNMRGHSKREDPAFWIIRLDKKAQIDSEPGARFISRFTKWRNAAEIPSPCEWHYTPDGERITLKLAPATIVELFRHEVESGNSSATDIADELEISKGWVSKLAKKGVEDGWMQIKNGRYEPL